jgi:hypothetical protein
MDHHHQHYKFQFFVAITGALLLALAKPQARAQSANDSYPNAGASPISEASKGPHAESFDGADTVAIPPDLEAADNVDDSTADAAADNSGTAAVPVRGSVPPDDESGAASKNDAVLEIPQVINPANAGTPDQAGNMPSAEGSGSDADAAQSNQTGVKTAGGDDDLAATASQLGTLEDYENQESTPALAPVFFPPGLAIVQFPRLPALRALTRQPVGIPIGAAAIILPPTSSGPFPSTSPMLMGPRASPMLMPQHVGTMGSFAGGGLIRFHR